MDRRAEKSLSDLKGTDMYVHDGTPDGVFREIGNAMVGSGRHVTIEDQRQLNDIGGQYAKIAISDGTFLPKGSIALG